VSWKKNTEKKIEAYTRAVELDPQFVEALFNLGLAYKKQKDNARTEEFLRRAYQATNEGTNDGTKFKIAYELAAASRTLGKKREAEEALLHAKKLPVDPAMRAAVALELGRLFYEQGRLPEAATELRAGRQLGAGFENDFAELLRTVESETGLQTLYESAQRARAGGSAGLAKNLYEQIRAKSPNYRDVTARLLEVETALADETQKQSLEALYVQAQKYAAEEQWEMALVAYESVLQQNALFKDARVKLQEVRTQMEEKLRTRDLESEYAAGMAALRAKDWSRAILSFEKVLAADRNFRDARRRLGEAQNALERESMEIVAARNYAEGVNAMNRNDLGQALAAFEKVRKINPKYRNLETLLAELESTLATPASETQTGNPSAPAVDSLYRAALVAEDTDWMQARLLYEKIQILQPGYRDVVDRLAQARINSEKIETPQVAIQTEPVAEEHNSGTGLGWAFAALLVLPAVGSMFLSPMVRARFHMSRADYLGALRIYEKLLERNPKRVHLYPKLAHLYLLLGRTDERALKVFKTILQLNLVMPNLEQINTIVAQHFLTEGRTDSDAIQVFEDALKAEQGWKRQ